MNRKTIGIIILLVLLMFGNLTNFVLSFFPNFIRGSKTWHEIYCDADYFIDTDFIVTGSPLGGLPVLGSINDDPLLNRVYVITKDGEIKWEYNGLGFPHEVEYIIHNDSDHIDLLIANAASGSIDQINYPNKSLDWQWSPHLFNWTEFNPSWDSSHEVSNPDNEPHFYLINDVDFINGSHHGTNFDSILVSLKNLNMVFLVNYTAEMLELSSGDRFGNASNVYWHYGMYNDTNKLYKQHNPDMLPNGNIVISDSENFRIIEVDYSTKQIIWELNSSHGIDLFWAKDADYIEKTDTFLITDTGHNRIIEINRSTKEIVWEFKNTNLMLPYEADLLPNGNILISGGGTGSLLEISRYEGEILWRFTINGPNQSGELHVNFFVFLLIFNVTFLMVIFMILLYQSIISRKDEIRSKKKILPKIKIVFSNKSFNLLVFGLLIMLTIVIFSTPIYVETSTMFMRMAISLSH